MRNRLLIIGVLTAFACSDPSGPGRPLDLSTERASLSVGQSHSCAIAVDDRTYCWGFGGGPHMQVDSVPVAVPGSAGFVALSAGSYHMCAVTDAGAALCWGHNLLGSLGVGDTVTHLSPQPVSGSLRFAALNGGSRHQCGVAKDGRIYCWGSNRTNELGMASTEQCFIGGRAGFLPCSTTPISRPTAPVFTRVTSGHTHTCALTPENVAYCWGLNWYGQLGDGSYSNSDPSPGAPHVRVVGIVKFEALSAGGSHTCGLTKDGDAYCWGHNSSAQLGGGSGGTCSLSPCTTSPMRVASGLTFQFLTAGDLHTCALSVMGEAYCWGSNFEGQLGTAAPTGYQSTPNPIPVRVAGDLTFARLSAGMHHTCGITVEGQAYCWGANEQGQLGDGTTGSSNVPVPVQGGLTFRIH